MKVLGLVVLAACGLVQTQSSSPIATGPSAGASPGPSPAAGGHDALVVPDVAHLPIEQAKQKLRAAGVRGAIEVEGVDPDDAAPVACQTSPGAGRETLAHYPITLVACELEHPETTTDGVPDLRGMTVDEATKVIRDTNAQASVHNEIVVTPLVDSHVKCQVDRVCRVNPTHWVTYGAPIELLVLRAH